MARGVPRSPVRGDRESNQGRPAGAGLFQSVVDGVRHVKGTLWASAVLGVHARLRRPRSPSASLDVPGVVAPMPPRYHGADESGGITPYPHTFWSAPKRWQEPRRTPSS